MHSMAAGLFLPRTYFIGYASYCYVHALYILDVTKCINVLYDDFIYSTMLIFHTIYITLHCNIEH